MRRWVAAQVVILSLVGAPRVSADVPLVRLTLENCDHLDQAEVRRIFSAELGSSATDVGGPDVTEVTVACLGMHVRVRVQDPLSKKVVQRSFDPSSFDQRAESRLFAIAASELVLASWAELATNPAPVVAPEGVDPSTRATLAARAVVRDRGAKLPAQGASPENGALRLVGLGSVRAFFDGEGALGGGGLRLGDDRFRLVSWTLDALVEHGEVEGFGVTAFTFGGGILAHYRIEALTLRLGAGLRAGVVATTSDAGDSGSALAPWGWPLVVTAWTVRTGRFVTDLSGEAGYVVLPLPGPDDVKRGGWFSAQLGFGWIL